MSNLGNIARENCRTCLSCFNERNEKCSLMSCLAMNFDDSRMDLMKKVMATCSVTLFSDKEGPAVSEEVFICMPCVTEIVQMLNFLEKCIHSQKILQQASEVKTESASIWVEDAQEGHDIRVQPKVEIKVEAIHQDELDAPNKAIEPPNGNNNEHQQCHKHKPYICVICNENFKTHQLVKKHLAVKHNNALHSCRQCSQVFPSKYHLNLHKLKIHNVKKYSCTVCKCVFASVSSLKFHENIHLGQQPYSCSSCSKSFMSASVLREHENSFHGGVNSFRCHCGRSFTQKKKLQLHVRAVHEKDKPRKYSCPDCDKKFHHPYSLKNHLNTHLGIKPFLCNACGSAFTALSNLTSHLRRIHSGDRQPALKKHLCHACGASFARAAHLQRHALRKHVPNAERKHECPVCKKRFLEKSDVAGHVKLHVEVKPFACEQCPKCFRTAWRLQGHVKRVHLGLRPFECPTCWVKFKTKSHLEKHIRTHTGERPFRCPHCSYACAEKSNLKKHINVHLKRM